MGDEATSQTRRYVVGLGNPGRRYARTRHNVGFRVLEQLADRWTLGAGKEAFEGLCWQGRVHRTDEGPAGKATAVVMLAPMTFMNRSGRSVAAMARFYKARPEDLLVIMDDLALPTGQLRLRASGSAGGHNGLDDILRALGTDAVPRLRIGIGQPPGPVDPRDYVLGKFTEDEEADIRSALDRAADAVEAWAFDGLDKTMERYNRKT